MVNNFMNLYVDFQLDPVGVEEPDDFYIIRDPEAFFNALERNVQHVRPIFTTASTPIAQAIREIIN